MEGKREQGGMGKRDDKLPAASSATLVKIPKKKGRKVKPKGMFWMRFVSSWKYAIEI